MRARAVGAAQAVGAEFLDQKGAVSVEMTKFLDLPANHHGNGKRSGRVRHQSLHSEVGHKRDGQHKQGSNADPHNNESLAGMGASAESPS
jgi:hypothetical protein